MPSYFMAADLAILHHPVSGTAECIIQMNHAFLQAGGCSDDLKGGAWLIGIIDTSIPPHLVQGFLLLFIRHRIAAFSRIQGEGLVQVELRHIYHGKYLPVLRIHKQDSHLVCLLFFHYLFRHLLGIHLDIIIQAYLKRISRYRLHHPVKFHASGIRCRQYRSINSL